MTTLAPPPAALPDERGHFGQFGGMFVPETLMAALHELAAEYAKAKNDPAFQRNSTGCSATTSAGRRRSISRSG